MRDGFLAGAAQRYPAVRPPSAEETVRREFGGLTAREREVAALIARGASNREIAELLFIGERTVARHVGATLAKLGFTSRTQVAAWEIERGRSASSD